MAKITVPRRPPIVTIKNFRGVNQVGTPTQIGDTESPDMLNIILDKHGRLDKRIGYSRVFPDGIGPGKVNGLYTYRKADGTKFNLFAHGTDLYTWDTAGSAPVSIYSGLADAPARFFTFGGFCYIMDGTSFLRFDGTAVVDVVSVAYVPTLIISAPPAGGGTANEDFNLLGAGFRNSFSGDGTAKIFQLNLTNLDATAVTATVGTVAKVEGTDFTVNRTTGTVTFTTAPATGVPNNVVITAYKTVAGKPDFVRKCTGFEIYGGSNDTRVFLFGHPDFPNTLRRCGLQDPTYWPENGFANVGSDAGMIKRLVKQFSRCNIIKEAVPNDTTIFSMSFELDGTGIASFPIVPLNSGVGCNAPDSLQLIENTPTFLSPNGVYGIIGSNVSDERNVTRISDNVHSSLADEINPEAAVSVDFDGKYILAINGNCYVYDYRHSGGQVWYLWDNIPASCFLEIDGQLYFGSEGIVYRFNNVDSDLPYVDDGVPINAYWKSKVFSFDDDEHVKTVEKIFFSLNPSALASADIHFDTDRGFSGTEALTTLRVDILDFRFIDFEAFTFETSALPQEFAVRVRAKKIVNFQIIIRNNRPNETMGILSVGVKYQTQREVK